MNPALWRSYRATISRAIGWSMAEIMALPWDEFVREYGEARRILST